jgi:D-alanyl-D-alanine carboxypeptidase
VRHTNRKNAERYSGRKRVPAVFFLLFSFAISFSGCGAVSYELPYAPDGSVSSFNVIARSKPGLAEPFAQNLCIVTGDVGNGAVDMSRETAAALFDVEGRNVLYSQNAHERLHPASLTKVMTALVALKHGTGDQVLTATETVKITESGAQLCGVKAGDTMTLDQALRILLIYSANDVAMMIAENIGGTADRFVQMMNEEAKALGATNTSFANPHGLTAENHYTTVYDLYLIFQEAVRNTYFKEIIQTASYQTTYYDSRRTPKELSVKTTNLFLRETYRTPENITVIGGKTGTTNAAGHCLILLSKDTGGESYISVILKSASRDDLYGEMADLLNVVDAGN